jgi:sec-independent protein translocase protein TatB
MFDIGWGELLLIGIVALIAIGPKELPGVMRTIGQWTGKLRRMASEFQNQFQEAMREAEMADLKKQVDDMTSQAQGFANFDPIGDVRHELDSTQQQIESAVVSEPAADPVAAAEAAGVTSAAPPAETTSAAPAALPSAEAAATAPTAPANEPATVGASADVGKADAGDKPA